MRWQLFPGVTKPKITTHHVNNGLQRRPPKGVLLAFVGIAVALGAATIYGIAHETVKRSESAGVVKSVRLVEHGWNDISAVETSTGIFLVSGIFHAIIGSPARLEFRGDGSVHLCGALQQCRPLQ